MACTGCHRSESDYGYVACDDHIDVSLWRLADRYGTRWKQDDRQAASKKNSRSREVILIMTMTKIRDQRVWHGLQFPERSQQLMIVWQSIVVFRNNIQHDEYSQCRYELEDSQSCSHDLPQRLKWAKLVHRKKTAAAAPQLSLRKYDHWLAFSLK